MKDLVQELKVLVLIDYLSCLFNYYYYYYYYLLLLLLLLLSLLLL